MDFAATLECMLDMYEHTNDRFIIGMYVKKGEFNCTQVFLLQQTTKSQVTFIYIVLLTIQIETKHCTISNRKIVSIM